MTSSGADECLNIHRSGRSRRRGNLASKQIYAATNSPIRFMQTLPGWGKGCCAPGARLAETSELTRYSIRNACAGSIDAARRAGIVPASPAVAARMKTAPDSTCASTCLI